MVASLQHLFASFYKAALADHQFFDDDVAMKFKSSMDALIKNFPHSSITKLLNELPKSTDQYILHNSMWVFFNKWNLTDEIAKLDRPSFSSSLLPHHRPHVFAVKSFLALLNAFKNLYSIYFTRNVNEAEKVQMLSSMQKLFSKMTLRNDFENLFSLLLEIVVILKDFSYDPIGIFLDIVLAYLLTYLVKILNIETIDEFQDFVNFLKNKKIIRLLCPHLFLEACNFV